MSLGGAGRILLAIGLGVAALGGLLLLLDRAGLTKLPGDVVLRGGRVTVYIPLGLSILASIVLTVVLNLIFRR